MPCAVAIVCSWTLPPGWLCRRSRARSPLSIAGAAHGSQAHRRTGRADFCATPAAAEQLHKSAEIADETAYFCGVGASLAPGADEGVGARQSPVHGDGLAIDIRGLVAREEQRHGGDLLGLAGALAGVELADLAFAAMLAG